jgi:hypothetical protein
MNFKDVRIGIFLQRKSKLYNNFCTIFEVEFYHTFKNKYFNKKAIYVLINSPAFEAYICK